MSNPSDLYKALSAFSGAAVPAPLTYLGVWNATTNNPTLESSAGVPQTFYIVSVAGDTDLNGNTDWQIGDWALFNGSIWQRIPLGDYGTVVGPVNSETNTVALWGDTSGRVLIDCPVFIDPESGWIGVNNLAPSFSGDFSDGIIVRGALGEGQAFPADFEGAGLAFDSYQLAIRGGTVESGQGGLWDLANIGNYSISFGLNPQAKGLCGIAIGSEPVCASAHAIAIGEAAQALGVGAVCVGGSSNVSSGIGSVVIGGTENNVSGNGSFSAGGNNATIGGTNSVGFGTAPNIAHDNCFVYSSQAQVMITTGDNQCLLAFPGGFMLNTNNPIAGVYLAKGSGPGSFIFSGATAVLASAMENSDVGPYVSADTLMANFKGATGTEHTVLLGVPTPGNSSVLVSDSVGGAGWTSSLNNGHIVIGSSGSVPVAAHLTAGTGIAITNGPGSISLATKGGGITWTKLNVFASQITPDEAYIAAFVGDLDFILPTTAAVGSVFYIAGCGIGDWTITQNAGQYLRVGAVTTTVGVGGSVASTTTSDAVQFVCTIADTEWTLMCAPQGVLTVV